MNRLRLTGAVGPDASWIYRLKALTLGLLGSDATFLGYPTALLLCRCKLRVARKLVRCETKRGHRVGLELITPDLFHSRESTSSWMVDTT